MKSTVAYQNFLIILVVACIMLALLWGYALSAEEFSHWSTEKLETVIMYSVLALIAVGVKLSDLISARKREH